MFFGFISTSVENFRWQEPGLIVLI